MEVIITLTNICNSRKASNFKDLLEKAIEFAKNPGIKKRKGKDKIDLKSIIDMLSIIKTSHFS